MSDATRTKPIVSSYYNFDKLYSFNGVFNFAVGERGVGKTYGWQKKAIKAALEKGEEFIYTRRYKEELKISRDTFFDAVGKEFPGWDFKTQGRNALAAPSATRDDKKRDWKIIGYFIALSTAQQIKSVAFPRVKRLCFDEFIIEKGATHYLPDEAVAFQNLYSTIDRYEGRVTVTFLANSVRMENPYFLHYDIRPDNVGEWVRKNVDPDTGLPFVVVHFVQAEAFRGEVYQTRFGKFIKDSEYAKYAVENNFADANDNLIARKSSNAKYEYTVETKQGTFSVWIDWTDITYFIQEKRPREENLYTLIPEKHKEGRMLLTTSDKLISNLRTAWRQGNAYFDTPKARIAFIEVFRK